MATNNKIWRYLGGVLGPFGDGMVPVIDGDDYMLRGGDTATGPITAPRFISTQATGVPPFDVASTTLVPNLNAERLNGQLASFYQSATNLDAGTLPSARLSGAYTGITSIGTQTADVTAPRFVSTQAVGTAPLTVTSTTTVPNLSADMVDGVHAATLLQTTGDWSMAGTLGFGSSLRQMLNLYGTTYGIGVQNSTLYQRSASGFAWFVGGVHSATANDPGDGGSQLMSLSGAGGLDVYSTTSGATAGLWTPKATASNWLGFYDTTGGARRGWLGFGSANSGTMNLYNDEGSIAIQAPATNQSVILNGDYAVTFQLGGTEAARVHPGGYWLVGKNSLDFTIAGNMQYPTGPNLSTTTDAGTYNYGAFHIGAADASGQLFASFRRTTSGTNIGSISQVSTTGVAYNTTSDARLKTAVDRPEFDPIAVIKELRPRWFTWNETGELDYGLFAQEQFLVWPQGVTKGDTWQVDYGRQTPLLLAALQKAITRIEELESKVGQWP